MFCRRRTDGTVSLHWQGKLRGPDFPPVLFRFAPTESSDVVDVKGRQVSIPVLRPTTEETVEQKQQASADIQRALLQAMIASPNGSQQEWAERIGGSKSTVNRNLGKLRDEKLVEEMLGRWTVTPKGRKAILAGENEVPGQGSGLEF